MPTKYKVEITRCAESDVDEIWRYIAAENPHRASLFIQQLEKQVQTLKTLPRRCPLIPENEITETDYRHLLYENYRTIFRISEKTIYVMRIIHGARLLEAIT